MENLNVEFVFGPGNGQIPFLRAKADRMQLFYFLLQKVLIQFFTNLLRKDNSGLGAEPLNQLFFGRRQGFQNPGTDIVDLVAAGAEIFGNVGKSAE